MMTDPIADMLSRIRNATRVALPEVAIPFSRLKNHVAQILEREGFVEKVNEVGSGVRKEIVITLKYEGKVSAIRGIRRISKPGRRLYAQHNEIPRVNSGQGIAILSTSRGVMTDKEARSSKVGGELLCEIF